MSTEAVILVFGRLIAGFIASFLALWIWSRSRETHWLMIVLATVFYFGDTVLMILHNIGLSAYDLLVIGDISYIKVVAAIFPYIFFIIGFAVYLVRKR